MLSSGQDRIRLTGFYTTAFNQQMLTIVQVIKGNTAD